MKFFLTLLGVFMALYLNAQTDTVYVKDFSADWLFTDDGVNLPLVRKSEFKGDIIHFPVSATEIGDGFIEFAYPGPYSILVDGVMVASVTGSHLIQAPDETVVVTVFSNNLDPYRLTTQAFKTVPSDLEELKDEVVIVNPRQRSVFNDFYVLASVGLFIFFTGLAVYNRKALNEYYKLVRAVSPRELDENLLKSRPFTGVNLSVYLFFSLMTAYLIISIVHLAGLFPGKALFYPSSVMVAIGNWLFISLLVFGSIYIRYFFLALFSSLFQVQHFLSSHFYNSIRLALMAVTFLSVCFAALYFIVRPDETGIYISLYQLLLIGLVPISVVLYIKLMAASSFKNLHLFSYLCGTELIPYILILSLGINY